MSEEKSFWTTLPGILTGLAMVISAIGGLLLTLHTIGVFELKKSGVRAPLVEEEVKPQIDTLTLSRELSDETADGGLLQKLIKILRKNERGWNTNDIDLLMSSWHKEAKIMTGYERTPQTWHKYREGISPRIKRQSIKYHDNCFIFKRNKNKTFVECIADVTHIQSGEKETQTIPIHFEFIKDDGEWYLWSQDSEGPHALP